MLSENVFESLQGDVFKTLSKTFLEHNLFVLLIELLFSYPGYSLIRQIHWDKIFRYVTWVVPTKSFILFKIHKANTGDFLHSTKSMVISNTFWWLSFCVTATVMKVYQMCVACVLSRAVVMVWTVVTCPDGSYVIVILGTQAWLVMWLEITVKNWIHVNMACVRVTWEATLVNVIRDGSVSDYVVHRTA